jgi:ABC-type polysaccharide/polyol phosphate transport system ATPase subunit
VAEYAVEVEQLGKAYRRYGSPARRVGEWMTLGRWRGHRPFWALRGVDFRLRPGASLGLCGANGAGKSTLLKVLAGTTAPSEGRFRLAGRPASLLELGAGFHGDFSGRANVYMNAAMMGITRRETDARFDAIAEFAELGPYLDEPVRTYSSGMALRLGFSVAVAVDPEVLIVDEVFAVGDMYFQKKCVDKIYEFKRRNRTILFCSHSLYDIRQLCDEALWLKDGRTAAIGDSVRVTNDYIAFQRAHIGSAEAHLSDQFPSLPAARGRDPASLPEILDARIYRLGTDEEVYEIATGASIEIRVWWRNPRPEATPIEIGVGFLRQDMTTCGGMGTHLDGVRLSGERGCVRLLLPELALLSGQFLVPILLFDQGGVHKYQEYLMPENLVVRTHTREVGLFRLEHRWVVANEIAAPAVSAPRGARGSRDTRESAPRVPTERA